MKNGHLQNLASIKNYFVDLVVFYFVRNLLETVYGSTSIRVKPYSAGIDFSRQNLTSVDVRF